MKQIRIPYGNDITLEVDIFRMLADGTTEPINPEDIEGLEMRAVKSLDYSKHDLHAYVSEGKTYASIDGLAEGVYDVQLSGKIGSADISACEARSLALTYDNRDAYGGKLRQLRITEGNDFQLTLQLRDIDGKTIDASELTDVSVVLKNPTVCRYKNLTPVIAGTDIVCDVQDLLCGVYDIELTALHGGRNIRSCEHCAIAILYDSPSASALPAYSFEMPVAPSLVYCGCALSEDRQEVAMQFAVVGGGGVAPEIIEELRADIAALQAKDAEHDASITQIVDIVTALFELLSDTGALFDGVYEEIDKLEDKHDADILALSTKDSEFAESIETNRHTTEKLTGIVDEFTTTTDKRLLILEKNVQLSFNILGEDGKNVTLVQTGVPTKLTLTATLQGENNSSFIPEYLLISQLDVLAKTTTENTVTVTITVTIPDNTQYGYHAHAAYLTKYWDQSLTITARNLIVFGMGASAEDVATKKPGTKLAKSAAGQSYTGKVATDVVGTQKMYILVPDNVTLPTSFKVNTFAAEYKKGEKITVDGITYTPYASGGNYAAGKSITVVT
jgi:hypothetical protein